MTLEFQPKTPYGTTLLYPVNDAARELCSLLRVKTLSLDRLHEIRYLKNLGFEIKIVDLEIPKGL